MNKYTILCTQHTYGSISKVVEKEQVRAECERIKKVFSSRLCKENAYTRIEVINNETGEIREFWNNKDNIINF